MTNAAVSRPVSGTGRRLAHIELARLVCLVAVVGIHAIRALEPYGDARFVVDAVFRFSVPVFFMISGYLWGDKIQAPRSLVVALWKRLWLPGLVWFVFYYGLMIIGFPDFTYPSSPLALALLPLTAGPGFHLWFLPALFIGTALSAALITRLGLRNSFIIALGLYAAGCFGGLYLDLLGRHLPMAFFRNGFFYAPVFLIAGALARRGRWSVTFAPALLLAAAGYALSLAEGFLVSSVFPRGNEMSFGILLYAFGVFGMFLRLDLRDGAFGRAVNALASDVFGAYLMHLVVLSVVLLALPNTGVTEFLAAVILTTAVSLGLSRLLKALPATRRLV